MNLYLKYRPETLSEIHGNEDMVSTLNTMLGDLETCPHVFLLTGPSGCGKTTIGRIIAKQVGVIDMDFKEIDSADFRGIDMVREIRKQAGYTGASGINRAWLIDECHKLTNDAQNALLKILEDTPPHVYFILCTTDPIKLLPTIKGRCTQFQVNPLTDEQMFQLLRDVVKRENENLSKIVYEQIMQDSLGHPRNALQVLDKVLRVPADKRLDVAKQTADEENQSIELCRALIEKAGWKKISGILTGLKDQDPENIRRHVLGYCQAILLKGSDNQHAGLIMEYFLQSTYYNGFAQIVYNCYAIVK